MASSAARKALRLMRSILKGAALSATAVKSGVYGSELRLRLPRVDLQQVMTPDMKAWLPVTPVSIAQTPVKQAVTESR